MRVAITGGIGSGKSFVCQKLRERGIEVYDCDRAAKRLIRTSPAIRQKLTQLIGADAYTNEGQLNKSAVAAFLLASEDNARAIDSVVHPAVARDFAESGSQWMECAILFESGFDRLVDMVVAVTAPEAVRIERIVRRDNITEAKAHEWLARQWSQERVAARADYIIRNDGLCDVDSQLYRIMTDITNRTKQNR